MSTSTGRVTPTSSRTLLGIVVGALLASLVPCPHAEAASAGGNHNYSERVLGVRVRWPFGDRRERPKSLFCRLFVDSAAIDTANVTTDGVTVLDWGGHGGERAELLLESEDGQLSQTRVRVGQPSATVWFPLRRGRLVVTAGPALSENWDFARVHDDGSLTIAEESARSAGAAAAIGYRVARWIEVAAVGRYLGRFSFLGSSDGEGDLWDYGDVRGRSEAWAFGLAGHLVYPLERVELFAAVSLCRFSESQHFLHRSISYDYQVNDRSLGLGAGADFLLFSPNWGVRLEGERVGIGDQQEVLALSFSVLCRR